MKMAHWLLAVPLLVAAVAPSQGASIRDRAGMFGPAAVREAEATLSNVERTYQLPTTIETIDTLGGEKISVATQRHAERSGEPGLYVLIAKQENKIDVISATRFRTAMNESRCRAIMNAFIAEFKKGDLDAGLIAGAKAVENEASIAKAEFGTLRESRPVARGVRPGAVPVRRGNPNGGFGVGHLLGLGLLIFGVLFFVRLLGGLFGGGVGNPGMGRMGGPGYGPGYGGGGGGFMSSLFGGIGGALAGNWLYDQFSGRHGQGGGYIDNTSYGEAGTDVSGGSEWSGGADAGGGDWGGGGGDWGRGGGGGDWGGGGGDWGGGGGGDGGGW